MAVLLMIPLVDTHCHLLAGLDDGPSSVNDALEMCRIAWEDGTRIVAATAHLGERWPDVTPDRIRRATRQLASRLNEDGLPLGVRPCAEVAVQADLEAAWERGELMSVADRGAYVLLELPSTAFVDLRNTVRRFAELGVRPILTHPERHSELLHDDGVVEQLIDLGCLVQVCSDSIAHPPRPEVSRVLKRWVRRGLVHLLGSDGHSTRFRQPRMAKAYRRIARWAGPGTANRICSTNGLAVLEGLPLQVPKPEPPSKGWLALFR